MLVIHCPYYNMPASLYVTSGDVYGVNYTSGLIFVISCDVFSLKAD